MRATSLDLVREVLDHEVVDSDGIPCGMIDDVELAGTPGGPLTVEAILIGPGAWQSRLPRWIARLCKLVAGSHRTRIEWPHIVRIAERIELDCPASALHLNAIERRWQRWMARVPGS